VLGLQREVLVKNAGKAQAESGSGNIAGEHRKRWLGEVAELPDTQTGLLNEECAIYGSSPWRGSHGPEQRFIRMGYRFVYANPVVDEKNRR